MENLLASKKKDGPSAPAKEQYQHEWLQFVAQDGFSEAAQNYLIRGYMFDAAKSFVAYCLASEQPEKLLTEMVSFCGS